MEEKLISIVVPNYNRSELLVESFSSVIGHSAIGEVVVQDDCSSNFSEVERALNEVNSSKIKIFRNDTNLGTFLNKKKAMGNASYNWCILLDSDNIINTDHVERIVNCDWSKEKLISPQRLVHHPNNCLGDRRRNFFDYEHFVGIKVDMKYCSTNWNTRDLPVLLNTGNFFVNKEAYASAFEINTFGREVDIADVAYFNYLFLKNSSNNFIEVLKDLEYVHRVHPGSFFLNNSHLSEPANIRLRSLLERESRK